MYGTSAAVDQTAGGKDLCRTTYRTLRTNMHNQISGHAKKKQMTTHALATDPEVAPLELPEDLQELLEEPGDLRC